MPKAEHAHAELLEVCVEFEEQPCQEEYLSQTYSYEKNPYITSIHPERSFLRWVGCTTSSKVT